MNVAPVPSSTASTQQATQQASTARAADGDYKAKGIGHEVKDSDGDYKPTAPTVSSASPVAASASSSVQTALLSLTKGGA